jgi:integrase
MANVSRRRTASGEWRYDVRYRVNGRAVERAFKRRQDADDFRRQVEAAEVRGVVVDPRRSARRLGEYAEDWLRSRRRVDGRPLAPRTVELYRDLLDRLILPTSEDVRIGAIRTEHVRTWLGEASRASSPGQAAKAYRLLRAILTTAVEDEQLPANPCRIRGAGVERSAERPFVDADVVLDLSAAIGERYSALVLLAGFGGLRLGELLALRRGDIDVLHATVRVDVQAVELRSGQRLVTGPKTDAGRRLVHLPEVVTVALDDHVRRFVGSGPEALVFTGPLSEALRLATLYKAWNVARDAVGQPNLRIHDLRHAAGTLAAQTGATQRELMARLGHATPSAAQRYQHAAERRDADIAAGLDRMVERAQRRTTADIVELPRA